MVLIKVQSRFKHEIITQINNSQKNVKNFNSGVILIDEGKNSLGTSNNPTYERKEEKTYWFDKYLQDLQKRGISQKIGKNF